MDLERDIVDILGTECAILYFQGFSTVSSVIPIFSNQATSSLLTVVSALLFIETGLICMLQEKSVDMLIGSVTIGRCSSVGFCAGSRTVVDHQVLLLSLYLTVSHRK